MELKMYLAMFFMLTVYVEIESCPSSSSKPAAEKFHAETNNRVWWPGEDLNKDSSTNNQGDHSSEEEDEQKNSYQKFSGMSNEAGVTEKSKSGSSSTSNNNNVNTEEQPQITTSREPHHHHRQQETISYYQENGGRSGSIRDGPSSSSSVDLIESSISTFPEQKNLYNHSQHHHYHHQQQRKDKPATVSPTITNNNGNGNSRRILSKSMQGLGLVHFSNKSITCNDGTPAGYYIRKSTMRGNDDNLWIIFLEGGWYCFDQRSCLNRWHRLKHLMSSDGWPNVKQVGGILSSDPQENPYWWNANHIFVPYCSSDTWSGRVKGNKNGNPFSFMGAIIIDEVIKNLVNVEGLNADSSVILAGSSAGGTGVMINLDHVENLLAQEFGPYEMGNQRVRGISDSGWFIDKVPVYSKTVNCNDVILCPPEISLRKGMNLWNARLPESCQDSHPDEPWTCFFGYRIYPNLKASLFVFQWLFDEAQMIVNNVPTPAVKKEEWDYVYKVGDELKKTLLNVTNVFIPSCLAHTVLTHRDWNKVEVNSVELTRALKCWESGGIIEEESNFIPKKKFSQKYWEDDDLESSQNHRGVFRHGKLYNSTPSSTSSSGGSSLSSSDRNYNTPVLSNDSSRRNRRRHNRHRHNKQSNNNNSQSHRHNRRRRKKPEKREKLEQKSNSRSRSSKSTKSEHRQRSVDRLPESNSSLAATFSNSGNLEGVTTTASTSSISRPNNNNSNKNNNRNHSKSKQKKRKRNRRWYSICDAANGISRRGGATEIQLIEKCSWPQCNKSCPKLLNPLTGEEVDFKDLLKSFGLDLATMAKALGIDLATLNSMDHHVLLQMLTQHA